MITIQRVVRVERPIEKVSALMQDFCTTNSWDPGTVHTERVSGDGGLGTTYRNVSKFAGRKVEMTYTVDALRDGEMISIRGENKSVKSRDTMMFNKTESGTEVVYNVEFVFEGPARFIEPLLRLFVRKLGNDGERGIREYLNRIPLDA
jgi:hypothetical protein